jgi:hypothetical protein
MRTVCLCSVCTCACVCVCACVRVCVCLAVQDSQKCWFAFLLLSHSAGTNSTFRIFFCNKSRAGNERAGNQVVAYYVLLQRCLQAQQAAIVSCIACTRCTEADTHTQFHTNIKPLSSTSWLKYRTPRTHSNSRTPVAVTDATHVHTCQGCF